jgi:hypothetical protein
MVKHASTPDTPSHVWQFIKSFTPLYLEAKRKNKERGTHNAEPLETPDKAFNTALWEVKLPSYGDALKPPVRIAGVYFLCFTDAVSTAKAKIERCEREIKYVQRHCISYRVESRKKWQDNYQGVFKPFACLNDPTPQCRVFLQNS